MSGSEIALALAEMDREVRRAIDEVMRNIAQAVLTMEKEANRAAQEIKRNIENAKKKKKPSGTLVGEILDEVHEIYTTDVIFATKAIGNFFFSHKLPGGAWTVARHAANVALGLTAVFTAGPFAFGAGTASIAASFVPVIGPYIGSVSGGIGTIFLGAGFTGFGLWRLGKTFLQVLDSLAPTDIALRNSIGATFGFLASASAPVCGIFRDLLKTLIFNAHKHAPAPSNGNEQQRENWLALERALEERCKRYANYLLIATGFTGAALAGLYSLSMLANLFGGQVCDILEGPCNALVPYGVTLGPHTNAALMSGTVPKVMSTFTSVLAFAKQSPPEQVRDIFVASAALYVRGVETWNGIIMPPLAQVTDATLMVLCPEKWEDIKSKAETAYNGYLVADDIVRSLFQASDYATQKFLGIGEAAYYLSETIARHAPLLSPM